MPRAALRSQPIEAERGALRALKNWLLSTPAENPFADPGVQMRMAAVITLLMERSQIEAHGHHPVPAEGEARDASPL